MYTIYNVPVITVLFVGTINKEMSYKKQAVQSQFCFFANFDSGCCCYVRSFVMRTNLYLVIFCISYYLLVTQELQFCIKYIPIFIGGAVTNAISIADVIVIVVISTI